MILDTPVGIYFYETQRECFQDSLPQVVEKVVNISGKFYICEFVIDEELRVYPCGELLEINEDEFEW